MAKDWDAVARAIDERLAALDMTQAELAHRAGVAQETLRELRGNLQTRRRHPRTLAAISEALGWDQEHLARVLSGDDAAAGGEAPASAADVAELRQAYADLAGRVDALERRMGEK